MGALSMNLQEIGKQSKLAAFELESISTDKKNEILIAMAKTLREHTDDIISANALDMERAKRNGMNSGLLDRLYLDSARVNGIADGLEQLVLLDDPIGKISDFEQNKNGLQIGKMSVPIGVIAMIYEGRPNVTIDAAGLCLKSSNSVILRGSSSCLETNLCTVRLLQDVLNTFKVNKNAIQLIVDTSHETVQELLKLNEYVDLAIPRGGANLINMVVKNATVPVIETGTGNCHIFVDSTADINMAVNILLNGKTQRVGVCNALESMVIMEDIASDFFEVAIPALREQGVEVYGCHKTLNFVSVLPASEEDFYKEYGDYKISCKIVENIDEAIQHINRYSTGHSECIITENYTHASMFLAGVHSACVYVNASTRFSDGNEFGFGAEIGISTQKIHARGPMGLNALTSYKYIIFGNGQVRV